MTNVEHTDGAHALERLLTICSDGVEGYRVAAAKVGAPHLHALLQRNEVEREEIASVLTNALVELGAKPDHHGSLAGAVHRGWVGALGSVHADDAIVRECTRGDQVTLAAFAEALSHELPADIRDRIESLLRRVLRALERLSSADGTPPTDAQ
ncbi:MAG: hypothetical protein JWP87_6303 [Labilithrix sp.]|nr:hypothetical protein [Labilithrix sp.]